MMRLSLLGLLTVAYLSAAVQARDNWPRFRGPNADGVAPDNTGLPTTWTTTENVKWISDVPGWGWSCPIVWGDRVFLSTVVSDEKNVKPSKGLYLGQGVRDPAKGIHHWLVYFLSEDGLTYVVKAGPEFEIVERNHLDELCIASPAVVGEKLLIRTASKLYCLTEGAKLDAAASARLKPYRSRWSVTSGLNGSKDSRMVQAMARSRMIRK
jgi:hypothetical protein